MHRSALDKAQTFVDAYLRPYESQPLKILDVGSMSVDEAHATHRPMFAKPGWTYVGADIAPGPNVDLVLGKPYDWHNIPDEEYDVVISSQAFEHIEYPWVTIFETTRVLKRNGIACLIAPAGGSLHRHPYDCWRYYPDGFSALCKTAGCHQLEVHTQWNRVYSGGTKWMDSVLIMQKPEWDTERSRIEAMRARSARMLVPGEFDERTMNSPIDFKQQAPSIILPTDGKNAIAHREEEVRAQRGTFSIKMSMVAQQLRGLSRAIRNQD